MTTRYLGHCQICEGEFKLDQGRLVHHGYKRPGDGHTHGSCGGVGEPPYEVSCEACKGYLVLVLSSQADKQVFLAHLQSGEQTVLYLADAWGRVRVVEKDKCSESQWANSLQRKTWEVEGDLRQLQWEINRLNKRIAAWAPSEVRSVDEQEAEIKVAKAERAKVIAEKRAEKAAKEEAKEARKAALEARRESEKTDFFATVRGLASQETPDPKAVLKVRQALKRMTWLHCWDCDPIKAEMVRIGLMTDRGFFVFER